MKFRILLPALRIYLLEVSAHAWLKVATKGSFRDKAQEKQKWRSATKVIFIFCHNFGTFMPFSDTYFLEVSHVQMIF